MDNNFMNEYNLNINMDVEILNKYWVSQKNTPDVWFDVKLKTTVLTQYESTEDKREIFPKNQ